MFERFTDRARQVMALANQEAQRFNHEYIGTEHILLGLIKEGTGTAARVLIDMGVDIRQARMEVEKLIKSGPDMVKMGKLPQTPRAKQVIAFAIEEARSLKHDYVGTEHLLLGLIREKDGVASQVLMNLGLQLDPVRESVLHILGLGTEAQRTGTGQSGAASTAPAGPRPFRPEWLLQRAGADVTPGAGLVLAVGVEGNQRLWDGAIRPALEANGLAARRAEHVYEAGVDPLRLQAELWSAAVVIADLGGRDPGTLFALGLCEALGRAPILLARSAGDLPVHLRSSRFIPYDPYDDSETGMAAFRDRLTDAVRSFLAAVRPRDGEASH
jgi:hypothetical protein